MHDIDRVANLLADTARDAILPFFRRIDLEQSSKLEGGYDPVTEADRAAERAMRDILDTERPQDSILGEEYGPKSGTSGLTWVLDPIDGTRSFVSGTPTWGVLIAASLEEGPIFGLIDQPYIGERFIGAEGSARMNGPRGNAVLRTSQVEDLAHATLFTTFPEVGTPSEGEAFRSVSRQVRLTRYGLDCYAYALLAAGQIELVIEAGLQPYDVHAPIAVIEAAGGLVTDWDGGRAHGGGRVLAAANAAIHAHALSLLRGTA